MSFYKRLFRCVNFVILFVYSIASWGTAHFNFATGELSLPVVAVQNSEGKTIQHYSILMALLPDSQSFELIKAIPTELSPASADAIFIVNTNEQLTGGRLQIATVEAVNPAGIVETYYQAELIFNELNNTFSLDNVAETESNNHPFQRFYLGTETLLPLKRGSNNQYLLPVEIGNQVLNLLVDTGSNGLLVFEDALATSENTRVRRSNEQIQLTGEQVSKGFASTQRSGVVAVAPVRIGAFYDPDMRIMLIREPTSATDPSLSIKNADGIIGLRRLEGVTRKRGELDIPLQSLQPAIQTYELNLPPEGLATLSLGSSPHFANVDAQYIFQTKTFLVSDGVNLEQVIHTDLQVPFNISSSVGGVHADEFADLDVLLDTGAVSKLVLDVSVAERIGYDAEKQSWTLPPDEEVELSLIGLDGNIQLQPALTISDISVASYKELGVSFEAVLGINHWQHYVVAYHHERDSNGIADGTLSLLHRSHLQHVASDTTSQRLTALNALNSVADEQHPSASIDGNRIAFQSNRTTGLGGWDIYVWDETQQTLLDLPNLNSEADDTTPCLSADGNLLVFQSLREGNADVLLYDLAQQQFLSTPNLNTLDDDKQPCLSSDGQHILFNSERDSGQGGEDLYLYERATESLKELPNLNENGDETQGHFSPDGKTISFNFAGNNYFYSLDSLSIIKFNKDSSINDDNANDGAISLSNSQIALHSNRNNPQLGLYDRDILLFNTLTQAPVPTPDLNSYANDLDPVFTHDGQTLLFSSNRANSLGGHDLYAYRLANTSTTASKPELTEDSTPSVDSNLRNIAKRGYTIPVTLEGQQLNLLVLTEFSGIALFTDKLTSNSIASSETAFDWLGMLNGTVGMTSVTVYGRKLNDVLVLLTDSQTFENQFTLLTDLPIEQIDGVFGLRQQGFGDDDTLLDAPIANLVPPVQRYELSLQNDVAYLSLGKMPHLDALSASDLINHYIEGSRFADIEFDSLIFNDAGQVANATTLFSTLVKSDVLIAPDVASTLGYQIEQATWGDTQSLTIHLNEQSTGKLLSVAEALPVQHAKVQDLSGFDPYTLILGQDFWQDLAVGVDSDEHGQLISVGSLSDASKVTSQPQTLSQFIPLPFNSEADEKAPDISADGTIIAFQSNAAGGMGGWDIYVYHRELGFLTLPELNSSADDQAPSINQDGSLIAFHSNRSGQDDIYIFHVPTRSFLDLSALNTTQPELYADLSGDGHYLAFQRDTTVQVAATPTTEEYSYIDSNIVLYDLNNQVIVTTEAVNTGAQENHPRLNQEGSLLVFGGRERTEMQGILGSVHIFDRAQGQVLDSLALFGKITDETAQYSHISPAGDYITFSSDRKNVGLKQRGQDIYLYDKATGEFLFLPGINSTNEDSAPALSNQAEYIVFQSHRAGGQGGYDLYLYQRSLDVPQYSTVMAYNEYGTVLGAGDVPLPFTQVNILDGNGNIINTVHSDAEGRFQATVPEGIVTPVTFASVDGLAKIVTSEDDDARDTELPLFTPGNIKFTGIDTPVQGYAGMPMTVEFELETEQIKYNTHIQVFAKNLAETEATTAAQLDINRTNFNQIEFNAQIASILIEQFGHRQSYDQPLVLNPQDGITTELTYQPGTDNRVVHVKHSFILPTDMPEGDYGLVFTINKDDLVSDDDHLQAEAFEDLDDNYRVSRQTLSVGLADKPNLHILTATTAGNNSFFLPEEPATEEGINPYGDFGLNLEVESLAQDVIDPVDVTFEIEVDGQRYLLAHAIPNAFGDPVMTFGHRFEQKCDNEGCVTFEARKKRGMTFGLSLTEEVYEYLKAKTEDTFTQLVVTVDPDNHIEEFQDYKADNVRKLPLLYIAPEQTNLRARKTGNDSKKEPTSLELFNSIEVPDDYEKSMFNVVDYKKKAGNDRANIAFIAKGPTITYRTDPIEFDDRTIDLPTAASFKLYSQVPIHLLGKDMDLFFMGGYANVDANDLASSGSFAGLILLDQTVFSLTEFVNEKMDARKRAKDEQRAKDEKNKAKQETDARVQNANDSVQTADKNKAEADKRAQEADERLNNAKTEAEKEAAKKEQQVAKQEQETARKEQEAVQREQEAARKEQQAAEKVADADKRVEAADEKKAEADKLAQEADQRLNKAKTEAEKEAARKEQEAAKQQQKAAEQEQEVAQYEQKVAEADQSIQKATANREEADKHAQEADESLQKADQRVQEANERLNNAKTEAEKEAAKKELQEAKKQQQTAKKEQQVAQQQQETAQQEQDVAEQEKEAVKQEQEAAQQEQEEIRKEQERAEADERAQAAVEKEAEADKRAKEAEQRLNNAKTEAEREAARKEQAEAKQQQEEARKERAEAKQQQMAQYERKVAETDQSLQEATANREEADKRAIDADKRLQEADQRVQEADERLNKAQTKEEKEAARKELQEAKEQQETAKKEQEVAQQKQDAAEYEQDVAQHEQDVANADKRVYEANENKAEADKNKIEADKRLLEANQRVQEAEKRLQDVPEAEKDKARKELDDAMRAQEDAKKEQEAALQKQQEANKAQQEAKRNQQEVTEQERFQDLMDKADAVVQFVDQADDYVDQAKEIVDYTEAVVELVGEFVDVPDIVGEGFDIVNEGLDIVGEEVNQAQAMVGLNDVDEEEDDNNVRRAVRGGSGGDDGGDGASIILLDSTDAEGNEKWTKEWRYPDPTKGQRLEYRFTLGPVPMKIEAGVQGEVGVQGKVSIESNNVFTIEIGPSAGVGVFARLAIDAVVFEVGIGVDLMLLEVSLKPKGEIQLLPGYPLALFRIQAPLTIELLKGEFYAYVRAVFKEYKQTIAAWDAPYSWVFPIFPPQAWAVGAVERFKRMSDRNMIPATVSLRDQAPDLLTDDASAKYEKGQLAKGNITINDIQNGQIEAVFSNADHDDAYEGYDDMWEGFYNLKAQEYTITINADGAFCMGIDVDANGVIEDEESGISLLTGTDNVLHKIESIEVSGSGITGIESETPDSLTGQLVGSGCLDDDDDGWDALKEEWSEEWKDKTYNQVYVIKVRLGTTAARRIRVRYYNDKLQEKPRFIVVWSQPDRFLTTYTESGIPKYVAIENRIEHDWGMGSPLKDVVSPNNFDVEWEGKFKFEARPYMFLAKADDSITVELEGKEILSTGKDKGLVDIVLPMQNRDYEIKVNYSESAGFANARVDWTPYIQPSTVSTPTVDKDSTSTTEENLPSTGAYVEYYKTEEREIILEDVGGGILDTFPTGKTTELQTFGRYRFVLKVEARHAGLHEFYLHVGEQGSYSVQVNGEPVTGLERISSQFNGSGRTVKVVQDLPAGWYVISIDTFRASAHPSLKITPKQTNIFDWTVYPSAKDLVGNTNALYIEQLPIDKDYLSHTELDFQGKIGNTLKTAPVTSLYQNQGNGQHATAMSWEGDFEFESAVYAFYFSSTLADAIEVLIDGAPFVSSQHTIGRHTSADGRFTNTVFTIPMNPGKHNIRITYAGKLSNFNEQGALFFDWEKAEAGYYYPLLPGNTQALDAEFIHTQAPLPARNELDPTVRLYIEEPDSTGQTLSGTWAGVFNFGRGVRFISVDYVNDNANDQGECRLFVDGRSLFSKDNDGWVAGNDLVEMVYPFDFLFSGQHALALECRNVTAPAEFIMGAPKTDQYPIVNRVVRSDCVQKQNEGTASGNPAISDDCEKAKPEQKRWIFDPVTDVGGYLRDGGKYTMCLSLSEDNRIIVTDCCIGGVQQHRAWTYNDTTGAIQHATQPEQCLTKADDDPNGQLYLQDCKTPLDASQMWRIPNTKVYKDLIPTPVRQCEGYLTLPTGGIPAPMSIGRNQTCAVTQQGGVRCWGEGLGNAPMGNVPDVTDAVALASSNELHCAVDMEGKVRCWDTTLKPVTNLVADLANDTVLQLVAGDKHHCALLDSGRVKCWGDNSAKQLGHTGQTANYVLTENDAPQEGITAIAAAGNQTCAVMSFGRVGCWGNGSNQVKFIVGLGRVQQLSIAEDYGCAILDDSSVQCWGKNQQGRLGNGTDKQSNVVPEYVKGLRNGIVGLSVSIEHACAINHEGNLYCWGDNGIGQLGNDKLSHSATPIRVAGLTQVRHVSTSPYHSCAMLVGDAGAYCWGQNVNGELGGGSNDFSSNTPIAVGIQHARTTELTVKTGSQHSCLLDTEGHVLCWGDNQTGQLGTGDIESKPVPMLVKDLDNVVELVSQGQHNCALDTEGHVYCWGNNQSGQLGDGSDINRTHPVAADLSELLKATQPYGLTTHIIQLDTSHNHTCALLDNGQVACWGSHSRGELGRSDSDPRLPALVQDLYNVQHIAIGDGFSCAARTDRSVWCWGATPAGDNVQPTRLDDLQADQLRANGDVLCALQKTNDESYTATCIGGNAEDSRYNVSDLSTSSDHRCALLDTTSTNNIECRGDNSYGQLGHLNTNNTATVELADRAIQLATGDNHSCAVLQNAQIYCWGDNTYGQLGDGSVSNKPSLPVLVMGSQSGKTRPHPIATGQQHSCMLDKEQQVYCWGDNSHGQLGDGSQTNQVQPVFTVVGLASSTVALSNGGNSSCAINEEGAAFCWGANDMGQLGTGNNVDSLTAQAVLGLNSGVSHIVHTGNYACAIVNGGVQCWGSNMSGVLSSNDEVTSSNRPIKIKGLSGITDLAANPLQACVVVNGFNATGIVRCWGYGKDYPQTVAGLENIQSVSAEAKGFCALTTDGKVHCWNNNKRPESITLPQSAMAITSGRAHSCALLDKGAVYCWSESSATAVKGLPTDVTHINSRHNHTCAYTKDHKGYCWGDNESGQLGNTSLDNSEVATEVQRVSPIDTSDILTNATLDAQQHTCAISSAGIVSCWGDNTYGQLGNETTQHQYSPIIVSALTHPIQAVATGEGFTCVQDDIGQVQCWGSNSHAQLGDGSNTDSLKPVSVTGLDNLTVLKLSAGQHHVCALTEESTSDDVATSNADTTSNKPNTVYCWGNKFNATPIADLPSNLIALESNGAYNCVLSAVGDVDCWHNDATIKRIKLNTSLAISVGKTQSCAINDQGAVSCWDNDNPQPKPIETLHHSVISVVSGLHHHCAVQKTTSGNTVSCWNHDDSAPVFGQLGDGSSKNSVNPVSVKLANQNIVAITAGDNHTCAQFSNDTVQCWGQNYTGQLGDGTGIDRLKPVNASLYIVSTMQPLANLTQVTLADNTACALSSSGGIKCWGALGELVDYAQDGSWNADFTTYTIEADFSATHVVTGQQHACAITTPTTLEDDSQVNQLYCWGESRDGQLGNGSLSDGQHPQQVALDGLLLTDVTVGRAHTCALAQTGDVYCWGNNDKGQLGTGANDNLKPALVDTTAQTLFAKADTQCALGESLTCWGANDYAQLGNGNTETQSSPTLVQGINEVVTQLVGGTTHRCALTETGKVYCWGDNTYGQLGSDTSQLQASLVDGLGVITQLSSGDDHTCAVSNDNAVYCWGKNRFGQLGNGNQQNRAVRLEQLVATQVATGKQHSCALTPDGLVYCWGDNAQGQVGNMDATEHNQPVAVQDLNNIETIYARGDYSCALDTQGRLYCWGDNRRGQLGDATRVSRHTPALVLGPNDPIIAEGDSLDLILESDNPLARMTRIALNASDVDGNYLSWAVISEPKFGAAILAGNNTSASLTYISDRNFDKGTDSFIIEVNDGQGGRDRITINLHKGVDVLSIDQGERLDVEVTANKPTVIELSATATAEALQWKVSEAASHGEVSLNANVEKLQLTYTPEVDYVGEDSLTVKLTNELDNSASIVININVVNVIKPNNAPVIAEGESLTLSMNEDFTPLTISATDADEQDTLNWRISAQPNSGQASLSSTEGYTVMVSYVPVSDFVGQDQFTIEVSDDTGDVDSIVIIVDVQQASDEVKLVKHGDTLNFTLNEDQDMTKPLTVLGFLDDQPEMVTWTSQHPAITLQTDSTTGNVSVYYRLKANQYGSEQVVLNVQNAQGEISVITLAMTVNPINDPPYVEDESPDVAVKTVTVSENTTATPSSVTVPLTAVDVDGTDAASYQWTISTTASHGSANITPSADNLSANVIYVPNLNYNSDTVLTDNGIDDVIEVKVAEASGASDKVRLEIAIPTVDSPPVIENGTALTFELNEDNSDKASIVTTAYSISITAIDSANDTLTWEITQAPQHGSAEFAHAHVQSTGNNRFDNTLLYTPNLNYNGTDQLEIKITDSQGLSVTHTVNLTIKPINDTPIIEQGNSIQVTMSENGVPIPFALSLQAADVDLNDSLSWQTHTEPQHGSVTYNLQHDVLNVTYSPRSNYNGTDSFILEVRDSAGEFARITVSVLIGDVTNAPVIKEGTSLSLLFYEGNIRPITLHASDADGSSLSWTLKTPPEKGTANLEARNEGAEVDIIYTTEPHFNGTDNFVVEVSNEQGLSTTMTINLLVNPVNTPPYVEDESPDQAIKEVTLLENTADNPKSVTVPLVAKDVDGGDAASYVWSISQNPQNGSATITPSADKLSAELVYTPQDNYNQDSNINDNGIDDTLIVMVKEAKGNAQDTVEVRFSILPVNDPPYVEDKSVAQAIKGVTVAESTPDNPSPAIIPLVAKDVDGGDAASYVWSISQAPQHGSATIAPSADKLSAELVYTPTVSYNKDTDTTDNGIDDTLIVMVTEASGLTDTVEVRFSITPVNDPPYVEDESVVQAIKNAALAENTLDNPSSITLPLIAKDLDGGEASGYVWSISQIPQHGSATVTPSADKLSANLLYTPSLNYNQNTDMTDSGIDDTLIVMITEASGATDSLAVRFSITPVNSKPTILPVSAITMPEDNQTSASQTATARPIVIQAFDIDGTDSNDTGDTLTWTINSQPTLGSVTMNNVNGTYLGSGDFENTFNYTPPNNATGTTSFTVAAKDSYGTISNTVTIDITITPVNDTPEFIGMPYQLTTAENVTGTVTLQATDVDGDVVTWGLTLPPTNGTATLSNTTGTSQTLTYTPNAWYDGNDSITVQISDSKLTATTTIAVTITPNTAPQFVSEPYTLTVDEDNSGTVTLNTFDAENNPLTWSITANAAQGNETLSGTTGSSQTLTYQPNANSHGTDQFTVAINDGQYTTPTTVNVTVNPVNDDPVIAVGTTGLGATIASGTTPTWTVNEYDNHDNDGSGMTRDPVNTPDYKEEVFALNLSASDIETSASSLTWSISAPPIDGIVAFDQEFNQTSFTGSNPTIYYQGNLHYVGNDDFTVQVSDGVGGTSSITVNVDVISTNTPPDITVPTKTTYITNGQTSTPITLQLNATDPDGDTPYWSVINPPSSPKGTLTGADGSGTVKNLTYTPTSYASSYTETYTIQVDDQRTSGTNTLTLTFGVGFPPVIDQGDIYGNYETVKLRRDINGTYLIDNFSATDADGGKLTWRLHTRNNYGHVRFGSASGTSLTTSGTDLIGEFDSSSTVPIYYEVDDSVPAIKGRLDDSFILTVTDTTGFSASMTVNIQMGWPFPYIYTVTGEGDPLTPGPVLLSSMGNLLDRDNSRGLNETYPDRDFIRTSTEERQGFYGIAEYYPKIIATSKNEVRGIYNHYYTYPVGTEFDYEVKYGVTFEFIYPELVENREYRVYLKHDLKDNYAMNWEGPEEIRLQSADGETVAQNGQSYYSGKSTQAHYSWTNSARRPGDYAGYWVDNDTNDDSLPAPFESISATGGVILQPKCDRILHWNTVLGNPFDPFKVPEELGDTYGDQCGRGSAYSSQSGLYEDGQGDTRHDNYAMVFATGWDETNRGISSKFFLEISIVDY